MRRGSAPTRTAPSSLSLSAPRIGIAQSTAGNSMAPALTAGSPLPRSPSGATPATAYGVQSNIGWARLENRAAAGIGSVNDALNL